jgi:hypothetical protein
MGFRIGLVLVLVAVVTLTWADTLTPPVELLEGLRTGQIQAEFRGGGDTGVWGYIQRGETGPSGVTIAPGTQFWAQAGGRQGQAGIGGGGGGLTDSRYAQIWIPTACTNFNLRAPTEDDVMVASASPSPDMTRLCAVTALARPPQAMVQVAVWAVANDPPRQRLSSYLRGQAAASEGALTVQAILEGAAQLLVTAGLDPADYRLFW